jgi:hypothetical protein
MAVQIDERTDWKPVPPGHPDRAAFEATMRALGIEPASDWTWPDPEPTPARGWRYRLVTALLRLPTDEDDARAAEVRAAEREAEKFLPERVPPDDPERLAWEAELRAHGIIPAKVWNFPDRTPIRRPDWRDWLRHHLG